MATILQAQLKVPENSKLIGKTSKEIKQLFNVNIHHRHNPHPSEQCVVCDIDSYRLESDKFIHISGVRESIKKFTESLLEGC